MSEHESDEEQRTMRFKSAQTENHYGSESNKNKRQSSELIHFQIPLFSKTPKSAKSFETRISIWNKSQYCSNFILKA